MTGAVVAYAILLLVTALCLFGVGAAAALWVMERARAQAALQVDRAEHNHRAELTRVHDFYRLALERTTNAVQYGTPTKPEAITESDPTPEARLAYQIQEDVVDRGVSALRQAYAAAGLHDISDADLRAEVLAIAQGLPIQVSEALAPFVAT